MTAYFVTATGTNNTAGPNYAVQFNDTFNGTNWQKLADVAGNGSLKTVTNANPSSLQRFYRLKVP